MRNDSMVFCKDCTFYSYSKETYIKHHCHALVPDGISLVTGKKIFNGFHDAELMRRAGESCDVEGKLFVSATNEKTG